MVSWPPFVLWYSGTIFRSTDRRISVNRVKYLKTAQCQLLTETCDAPLLPRASTDTGRSGATKYPDACDGAPAMNTLAGMLALWGFRGMLATASLE